MNLSNNEKNIILLLGKYESSIIGSLRFYHLIYFIQSEIFYLNKQHNALFDNFNYVYSRWNYGPFSKQIELDISNLEFIKLLKIDVFFERGTSYRSYSLTDDGIKIYRQLMLDNSKFELKNNAFNYWIYNFIKMSQEEIIRYTYKKIKVSEYEIGDQINLYNSLNIDLKTNYLN